MAETLELEPYCSQKYAFVTSSQGRAAPIETQPEPKPLTRSLSETGRDSEGGKGVEEHVAGR